MQLSAGPALAQLAEDGPVELELGFRFARAQARGQRLELPEGGDKSQGSCRVSWLPVLPDQGQAAVATSLFFVAGLSITAGAGSQFLMPRDHRAGLR